MSISYRCANGESGRASDGEFIGLCLQYTVAAVLSLRQPHSAIYLQRIRKQRGKRRDYVPHSGYPNDLVAVFDLAFDHDGAGARSPGGRFNGRYDAAQTDD